MAKIYKTITFETGEFESAFPQIAKRKGLNESDKLRLALGLKPRKASAGAPKGNKNAQGNKGRWASSQSEHGRYIDTLVHEAAEYMAVHFVDHDDFVRQPAGLWALDRRHSDFRRFYFDRVDRYVELSCPQRSDFDEHWFKCEVRDAIEKLRTEE